MILDFLEMFTTLKGSDGGLGGITVGGVGGYAILREVLPVIISFIKSLLGKEKTEKVSDAIGHAIDVAQKIKIEIDKEDEHDKGGTRKAKSNKRPDPGAQGKHKS